MSAYGAFPWGAAISQNAQLPFCGEPRNSACWEGEVHQNDSQQGAQQFAAQAGLVQRYVKEMSLVTLVKLNILQTMRISFRISTRKWVCSMHGADVAKNVGHSAICRIRTELSDGNGERERESMQDASFVCIQHEIDCCELR